MTVGEIERTLADSSLPRHSVSTKAQTHTQPCVFLTSDAPAIWGARERSPLLIENGWWRSGGWVFGYLNATVLMGTVQHVITLGYGFLVG